MPIPDYQTVMLPLLTIAGDDNIHSVQDVIPALARLFALTDDEQKELLPSGKQRIFDNRIGWARTYLKKARLIEYAHRGKFRISARGKDILNRNPKRIDIAFLRQFPEFIEFQKISRPAIIETNSAELAIEINSPDDLMATGYLNQRKQIEEDLLNKVKSCHPEFFERLVVKLLISMGYGGSLADAGKAVGKSGDGGIDGVIKEDRLGLEQIYIQAKRWDDTSIGRPEIQKFVGALHGKRARKGIFLTTASFTKDACEYANSLEMKIILIDGVALVKFMFDYDIGLTTESTYAIKRIDSEFFEDENSDK